MKIKWGILYCIPDIMKSTINKIRIKRCSYIWLYKLKPSFSSEGAIGNKTIQKIKDMTIPIHNDIVLIMWAIIQQFFGQIFCLQNFIYRTNRRVKFTAANVAPQIVNVENKYANIYLPIIIFEIIICRVKSMANSQ